MILIPMKDNTVNFQKNPLKYAQNCLNRKGKTRQKSSIYAVEVIVVLWYNLVYEYAFVV